MITIAYSTRETNPELQEYFRKSSGVHNSQIIEVVNPDGKSLTEVYNEILEQSTFDIVILCHDDIYFDSNNWGQKIMNHFKRSDYGILGVAGSTQLPKSGMWWEDRTKMIGIVNHEHEGKKWTSKYSDNLGNSIKETVLVDGLFIALHKNRIKKNFDENVKGFHLYDVNFCFRNFIEQVKIGVVFDIKITHKSIGMTNEQWDANRKLFAEEFESLLPVKIKKTDKDKLKILIGCLFFKNFTGSEVYIFELSKNLVKMGHDVSVVSEIGGPLTEMAKKVGIKVFPTSEPPGYKMGDGKWLVEGPNGIGPSIPNTMYRVSDISFDIIHLQHEPITNYFLNLYPQIDKISTIHSEVIELEKPVVHDSIKHYICIRPEIKEHIENVYQIDESQCSVMYNPVDSDRFRSSNQKEENACLFVGTIDYLRENSIKDLVEQTRTENLELWLLGENKSDYLDSLLQNSHVKHLQPTWNTEKYINRVKYTAGILLGRTTIESWFCGKPSWIYDVDSSGHINKKTLFEAPTKSELEKFDSKNVTNQIHKLYLQTINS
jgi:hypothetical protein